MSAKEAIAKREAARKPPPEPVKKAKPKPVVEIDELAETPQPESEE